MTHVDEELYLDIVIHGHAEPAGSKTRTAYGVRDSNPEHIAALGLAGNGDRRHYLVCRRHESIANLSGERTETLYPWEPLGHSALNRAVARIAEAARVADPAGVTPHMLRRWALEAFLASTGDLHAAAELAGHKDVNQTIRYAGRARMSRTRTGVVAVEATILNTREAAIPVVGAPGIEPGTSRRSATIRDAASS